MKRNLFISLRLTLVMLVLLAVIYPLIIAAAGYFTSNKGNGKQVIVNGKVVGYELIGQRFTDDKYFQGRPSAVDYHADGSAGSNKGPSNPDYLKTVSERIDSFIVHNKTIERKDIPAELVTASGSGLDPHISPSSAFVQVPRIASVRNLSEEKLKQLIQAHTEHGLLSPEKINVLQLNIALDDLK
ncbi:potassium-transporting ATPase subunit KdpC [Pollutibacter soli]|uniref:potassium-transporting ATPase subunit KdpC n=1 Tax=Pollutibacter soli TaxID=3034157 RepID=UPI003013E22C